MKRRCEIWVQMNLVIFQFVSLLNMLLSQFFRESRTLVDLAREPPTVDKPQRICLCSIATSQSAPNAFTNLLRSEHFAAGAARDPRGQLLPLQLSGICLGRPGADVLSDGRFVWCEMRKYCGTQQQTSPKTPRLPQNMSFTHL